MLTDRARWTALTEWEDMFWRQDQSVAGVDEVGRGPLAGPVVAAAVILPASAHIEGLDDSKKLSERQRDRVAMAVLEQSLAVSVAFVGPSEIDRINILEASRLAMRLALERLQLRPAVVLSDAMQIGGAWQEWCLLHGDARSASIAAASVVAKVLRDRYMGELSLQYPEYGFAQHKGYPTRAHRSILTRIGPCPAHRRTFTVREVPEP